MTESLLQVVGRFASKRVLVLGDAMLDSYMFGTSTRLCQEAPVPVVAIHERRDCPGGAANTAVNLAALGCQVDFLSVVGADDEGDRLRDLLPLLGVSTSLLTISAARQTLSKLRIVNGDTLLARVDQGDTGPIPVHVEQRLLERLSEAFVRADAVVISDYAYGVMTPAVLGRVRTLQERFQQVIAVDARDLRRYRPIGVTVVKPNYDEALRLAGIAPVCADVPRAAVTLTVGDVVLDLCGARIAAITLDADGAIVVERGRPPHRTVARPANQARTAGAGDTYLAAFTLALASRGTACEAAEVAARAAEVVVGQDGTSVCRGADLVRALSDPRAARDTHESSMRFGSTARNGALEEQDGEGDLVDLGTRRTPALHQA
jgi:D-beta-D-heptose 7-phosphate kinase/D-beta-D-heptose 1-phosphate adenosyltransferase